MANIQNCNSYKSNIFFNFKKLNHVFEGRTSGNILDHGFT
jgi:hypothetical protein